jgi:hypothetical protein
MMTTEADNNLEEAVDEACANCGKAEVDDVKLKKCACKLVRYCSIDCQKNHRPQHKKACKQRMTEIRDDFLFRQPDESNWGECPICFLPLPLAVRTQSREMTCCSKLICIGCCYAALESPDKIERRCPFCREPVPESKEEMKQNRMKRAKANDPVALCKVGEKRGDVGDFEGAFEYFAKAAALGEIRAHYNLSVMYHGGVGVEKNMKKAVYHAEEAAIGGHADARVNFGLYEGKGGRIDRMMKHFIIAANLGLDEALERVKKGFANGFVSKEDYAAALRGHQAAVDATKSPQRDVAQIFFDEGS